MLPEGNPLSGHSALADTSGLVVKRTFIDFRTPSSELPQTGLCRRVCSDPGLFITYQQALQGGAESDREGLEVMMTGLSEEDTEEDTDASLEDGAGPARPGHSYGQAGGAAGGVHTIPTSDPSELGASEEPPPEVKAETPEPSSSLDQLLMENQRLAMMNKLLRENARLLKENKALTERLEPRAQGNVAGQTAWSFSQAAPDRFLLRGHRRPNEAVASEGMTTIMLRNLPNSYSRSMVLAMLNDQGFHGLYDFIYLPVDFATNACLGYAFVNLVDPSVATAFWRKFDGYSKWVLPSKKVCSVSWSGPHQGVVAHVERYRNSPVMHPSIPDEFKPLVFCRGERTPFPPPTKAPRAPRVRNSGARGRVEAEAQAK